jgi:antitoxin component YwqK of YwqJK toxin-antitoxin module
MNNNLENIIEFFSSDSGRVKKDYFKDKNNKIQGLYVEYYFNENKFLEAEYLDGKLNGFYKKYYIHGGLEVEGEYENGKKSGIFIYHFNNMFYTKYFIKDIEVQETDYKKFLIIKRIKS